MLAACSPIPSSPSYHEPSKPRPGRNHGPSSNAIAPRQQALLMDGKAERVPPTLPPSAVAQSEAFVGLTALVAAAVVLKVLAVPPERTVLALWVLVAAVAVPCLSFEYGKTAGGFDRIVMPDRARVLRVSIKLIGLMGTYALLALAYWALPIYRKEFPHFFSFVVPAIPALLLAAPFYLWLTDRRMSHPADGCFMAGLLVLGRTNEVDGNVLQDYAAGWLVKGFFAPIMFHAAFEDVQWFLSADFGRQLLAPYGWFDLPLRILYGVDVVWGGTGYLLTLRLFQTHVRSANPALDGWLVCVVCYAPIWGLIYRNYLRYEDGLTWVYWLSDHPTLRTAWGVAILILIGIYCWATLSFGARFSNLTHRGIVTNGPYRWSKHPAYVAKNLSWWLISMPFLSQAGASEAIRLSLLLLCVNAIYYWRAKTEERHLATDPVYAEYARWISEHGLAARQKRWLSRTLLQSRRPDRSVM